MNADGFSDLLIGAFEDDDGGSDAGATYLVLGGATPSDVALGAAQAQYIGEAAWDLAGVSMSTAGDVNGDCFGDVLIGAYGNDDGGSAAGAAYLVLGSATPGDVDLGGADAQYTGEAEYDHAGWSVSTAGDVNADGYGDVLLGASYNDDGGTNAGMAYLVLGNSAPGDLSLGSADAEYTGAAADDLFGHAVSSAGDVNADGFGDLLFGAYRRDDGGVDAGAAYLVLGGTTPVSLNLGAADAEYTGEADGDRAGANVSTAGDVNADGFDDLLIGASYSDNAGTNAGTAYLILGAGR